MSTVVHAAPVRPFRARLAWAFTRYAFIFPILQIAVWLPLQWTRADRERDTFAYHHAALMRWQGRSIYEPIPPNRPHHTDDSIYVNPPPLAAAFALLPRVSFQTSARIWAVVLLAAYWLYALALARIWTGRTALVPTLVAGALLGFAPGVSVAMGMGQADVVLWAAVGLALAFPAARSIGLTTATLLKVYPVWALGVALRRERGWRGTAIALGIAGAVTIAGLGARGAVRESMVWIRHVMPSLAQGQIEPTGGSGSLQLAGRSFRLPRVLPENMSPSYAPVIATERAGLWDYHDQPLPGWVRLYLLAIGIGTPVVGLYLTRKRPPVQQMAAALLFAALAGPIVRLTYLPMLIAPGLILYRGNDV